MPRILARIALVVLVAAVLYVATTRGFPATHRWVAGICHDRLGLAPTPGEACVWIVRKAFHIPAYALLAALVWWALPVRGQRLGLALGLVMAVAVLDELVQSRQPARTGRAIDLLVDLAGAMLGLWIAGAFRRGKPDAPPLVPSDLDG